MTDRIRHNGDTDEEVIAYSQVFCPKCQREIPISIHWITWISSFLSPNGNSVDQVWWRINYITSESSSTHTCKEPTNDLYRLQKQEAREVS